LGGKVGAVSKKEREVVRKAVRQTGIKGWGKWEYVEMEKWGGGRREGGGRIGGDEGRRVEDKLLARGITYAPD
jgi:hypothetical protein